MQRFQVAQAHCAVEVVKSGAEGYEGAQVVTGGEDVARVEADTDTGFIVDEGDDLRKVGEGGANHGAGSRHGFE